jgi:hypothetical protein
MTPKFPSRITFAVGIVDRNLWIDRDGCNHAQHRDHSYFLIISANYAPNFRVIGWVQAIHPSLESERSTSIEGGPDEG